MASLPSRRRARLFVIVLLVATPSALRADCHVGGSAAVPDDVVRARTACDSARARFAALFGTPAPAVRIVLREDAAYEVALAGEVGIVYWPNSGALTHGKNGAHADLHWQEVLPHEVMHALTMARFFPHTSFNGHRGYGTPLPDWFEEAIGIWGEPAASREARVAHARHLPAGERHLLAIVSGTHPAAADPAIMAAVPGTGTPPDPTLRAFYPRAIALLSFVHENGGPAAVSALGRRLLRDPADFAALAALPGLPGDMAGVIAAWNAWIGPEPGPADAKSPRSTRTSP